MNCIYVHKQGANVFLTFSGVRSKKMPYAHLYDAIYQAIESRNSTFDYRIPALSTEIIRTGLDETLKRLVQRILSNGT